MDMLKNDSPDLKNKILKTELQIIDVNEQYKKLQDKSDFLAKSVSILVFLPSLFLITNMHYTLFKSFGVPSLFIAPASVMVLAFLTGVGFKAGENVHSKKLKQLQTTIETLQDKKDEYQEQLQKTNEGQQKLAESSDSFLTAELLPENNYVSAPKVYQKRYRR